MKKEIKELIDQKKWQEANKYVGEHRDEFSDEELRELENAYRSTIGSNELDEDELAKVSGGTAVTAPASYVVAGNINYHCNDVSVSTKCHDSVSITSSCWFNDACTMVYHIYGPKDGWIGGVYNDLENGYW